MQVIRNELVEAFITLVNKVKLDHAVRAPRFSSDDFKRLEMLLQYRLKTTLHFGAHRNLFERFDGELTNDLLDERIVRISFDHLHQLQCRLFQLDALCGRLV